MINAIVKNPSAGYKQPTPTMVAGRGKSAPLATAQQWCDKHKIFALDHDAWDESQLAWAAPITETTFMKLILMCKFSAPIAFMQYAKQYQGGIYMPQNPLPAHWA